MNDKSLQDLMTVRDDILDSTIGRVKYRDLARWSRVLSVLIQEENDNAAAKSSR